MPDLSFTPETTEVVLVSFEGPDRYAMAGGLGTRMAELSRAFAEEGFPTHLIYVGDPDLPPRDEEVNGRLTLHRWAQWISRHHPNGVYDGEQGKVADMASALPAFLVTQIIRPALAAGRIPLIMLEEWHTAPAAIALSDYLHWVGLRERCVLLWNANNTLGFENVDWPRLNFTTTITTVSRFMKQAMWARGVDPMVIPNGIPDRWLEPVEQAAVAELRAAYKGRILLSKVARFDPDKRWHMAIAAVGELKRRGHQPVFVMKGGIEPHGVEVLEHAAGIGLTVRDVTAADRSAEAGLAALCGGARYRPVTARPKRGGQVADVVNIRSFIPEGMLRALYQASDAVLANSGREPFGLVGLEVMACGGLPMTGATGEEYLRPFENGISVESADHVEMATYVELLREDPAFAGRLRAEGPKTAERYTWPRVIEGIRHRLPYIARHQGVG